MAVRTRVEFLDREFLVDTSGTDGAQVLAQFAREQRDEAIAINRASTGHEPRYDTFVDGARSDRLESVRPDGVIVFEFDVGSDVVRYCYDLLILHSPILTGAYQRSHSIYADGVEVETPEAASGASEVAIVSSVPYARKIERGLSSKAPDGVYQVVATMAAQRFGNQARVRFAYRSPMGAGDLEKWAAANAARRAGGGRKQRAAYEANIRQPAITISFR